MKTTRKIIPKILAITGILACLLCIVLVPVSASNVTYPNHDGTSTVLNPHPYTPTSFTYLHDDDGYYRNKSLGLSYLTGEYNVTFSNRTTFYKNGVAYQETEYLTQENIDTYNYRFVYSDTWSTGRLIDTLYWDNFVYSPTYRDYFPVISLGYDSTVSNPNVMYGITITASYRTSNTRWLSMYNQNAVHIADMEDPNSLDLGIYITTYLDQFVNQNDLADKYIEFRNLSVRVIPYAEDPNTPGNYVVNVDASSTGMDMQYKMVTLNTPPLSLGLGFPVTEYEQIINDRNPTDLLGWLGDVLQGFLTTPVLTIGTMTISIGNILTTILGMLFAFCFLRFFSGG